MAVPWLSPKIVNETLEPNVFFNAFASETEYDIQLFYHITLLMSTGTERLSLLSFPYIRDIFTAQLIIQKAPEEKASGA